jgi:ankyrin repeat protein
MEGDLKRVTEMTDGVVMEARDLNEVDDMGWTALMWAVSQQHSGIVLELVIQSDILVPEVICFST